MRQTPHSRALRRAVAIMGGIEALSAHLGVARSDLRRWLDGDEPAPDPVFLQVVDLILDPAIREAFRAQERLADRGAEPVETRVEGDVLQFRIGDNPARCPHCDCIDFERVAPGEPLTQVTLMRCVFCGHELPRGHLVVLAAKDAVLRSSAAIAALRKRQRSKRKTSVEDDG